MLRSRRFVIASMVVVLLILGLGCWVAVGAFQAKSNLEQARGSAQKAKDSLLEADTKTAAALARDATDSAQAARDATHSLAWNIVAAVPWLGSPFKTGQQITDVVSGLATNVLQPAADIGVTISPERLYKDGRVDVDLLRSQEDQLSTLAEKATRLNAEAGAIQDPHYMATIGDARTQLQDQIADLTSILENTALAARLVPPMMGADGPRTYFMGFQTNAEARGTGGLLGGFGVLRFDNGTPTVDTLGSNVDLADAIAPIDLGLEYDQQYGFANPFTDFRNSNLSPHFPYTAQIWRTMWAQQTGTNVDGVIAIDPVALSYILGAVGPITMADGEVISKDNVVELTESTAYIRFPEDQLARKQYLQNIATAVVTKITGPVKSPRQLLDALGRAVSERRIAIWSSVAEEQKLLEETPLAHAIPDDAAPFAAVVLNNLGGNKLDYYLKTSIEYAADDCRGATRASTVTVNLDNTVPNKPLPDYVAAAAGLSPDVPIEIPRGTNITSVRLFATKDAKLSAAILNGERVPAIVSTERGHPVFEVQVIIPPGQPANISFQLSEPTVPGKARVPSQPLVNTVDSKVLVPECKG
ncbi:membrane protein [Mycolicibacterium rufum]|nr:membrane protein [Mycolicibacterium rufum]